jgi:hypothetical protein
MSKIVEEIIKEVNWLESPEFNREIVDKNMTDYGIFRSFMINIVHLAQDHGIDPVVLLKAVSIGYYNHCDTNIKSSIQALRDFGLDY